MNHFDIEEIKNLSKTEIIKRMLHVKTKLHQDYHRETGYISKKLERNLDNKNIKKFIHEKPFFEYEKITKSWTDKELKTNSKEQLIHALTIYNLKRDNFHNMVGMIDKVSDIEHQTRLNTMVNQFFLW